MQQNGAPATGDFDLSTLPALRSGVRGMRAVIDFAPKPTSPERVVAGVVTRLDDGSVQTLCAIDRAKTQHVFGADAAMLSTVAEHLCTSLAQHWSAQVNAQDWASPFEGARIADLSPFSAANPAQAHQQILSRVSAMYSLMQGISINSKTHTTGIVNQVKSAIGLMRETQHLTPRFNHPLLVHSDAIPMKVDFWGQNYACYFLQIGRAERTLTSNTERAFGKLFQLQALRKMVNDPKVCMQLLDDEKPSRFELVMVGDGNDPVQVRAIRQIETLADRDDIRARLEPSAQLAAQRVASMERLAA